MKQTIQIENTNCEDFKNEIINGVVAELQKLSQPQPEPTTEILLSRNEAAQLLSISLVSLWSLSKENIIPSYKIGKSVRYKKHEVLLALQKTSNSNLK